MKVHPDSAQSQIPEDDERHSFNEALGTRDEPASRDQHLSHLVHLTLRDFRSYTSLSLGVGRDPVVLSGPNGAGKTNVLEAISLFAPGRGLRRAHLADMTKKSAAEPPSENGFQIGATVHTLSGPVKVGTGVSTGKSGQSAAGSAVGSSEWSITDAAPQPDEVIETAENSRDGKAAVRRIVRIDGMPAAGPAEFQQVLEVVWLTPAMDRLFTEGAASRRRFLDQLIFSLDHDHARRVGAYERSMRERARLLRGSAKPDPAWLSALEAQMAEQGVAVAAARNDAVRLLQAAIEESVTSFPKARLTLAGELEGELAGSPALETEDAFRGRLEANRRRDADLGQTTSGPHRCDLEVSHLLTGAPAKDSSTGEQKALLIGIVLANARLLLSLHGSPPIVLLDEIAAHLDADRRNALFDEIVELKVQAWMTGTEAFPFKGLAGRAQHFSVEDGVFSQI